MMRLVRSVMGAAALVALTVGSVSASPITITVTANTNAAALVSTLISGSSGIQVKAGSEKFVGADSGAGTFTGASGILPFGAGVMLSNGDVSLAPGPNTDSGAGVDFGLKGDADLDKLLDPTGGSISTFDAASLQFQFKSVTGVFSFQYVFASEDYNEFTDEFSDVFGFFLNGVNIATLPGSGTPVSILTVNCGTNAAYYTSNTGKDGPFGPKCKAPAGLNTEYDGLVGAGDQSHWLFAGASGLDPNAWYTLKLAVADNINDPSYDSAFFLKSGSFADVDATAAPVPEPGSLVLLGTGLVAVARKLRRGRNR